MIRLQYFERISVTSLTCQSYWNDLHNIGLCLRLIWLVTQEDFIACSYLESLKAE